MEYFLSDKIQTQGKKDYKKQEIAATYHLCSHTIKRVIKILPSAFSEKYNQVFSPLFQLKIPRNNKFCFHQEVEENLIIYIL